MARNEDWALVSKAPFEYDVDDVDFGGWPTSYHHHRLTANHRRLTADPVNWPQFCSHNAEAALIEKKRKKK